MAHLQSDDKSAHIMQLENVGSSSSSGDKLDIVPGYGHERDPRVVADIEDEDNPNVHQKMNAKLFLSLVAMTFLWVGSQIPLYLFGAVLPLIYEEVGGAGRYQWMVIGYLIPNAALCPFVGNLSDMFGRRMVAAVGQTLLIIGPIITSTAHSMNVAVGGMVISGLGAGLNELIAIAGTAEMVPKAKRGTYVGLVVATILPFCPSVLYGQLIAAASSWRYIGILVSLWNLIGLVVLFAFYKDPARLVPWRPKMEIVREIDFVGGLLSTFGVTCFMLGMQWGASQYLWGSIHVLVPFIIGIVLILCFFLWEAKFAKHPMVPAALFSKSKRTMIAILLITFFSGGNFFAMLLFWPTQVYNVYGSNPTDIGIRTLPIGFGIIVGAALCLVSIPLFKYRTTPLMIFACALMTAGVGAVSISKKDNLSTVYVVVTLGSLGVGMVIIPCSILAQLACPDELIGTVTAITLSIRYIGGAIGFTAYYNIFFHKLTKYATSIIGFNVATHGIVPSFNLDMITELVELAATAQFATLKEVIATSPLIADDKRATAFDTIIMYTQEAFVLAYRYPYWMSISFGVVCVVAACFLRDIRHFVHAQ